MRFDDLGNANVLPKKNAELRCNPAEHRRNERLYQRSREWQPFLPPESIWTTLCRERPLDVPKFGK